MILYFLQKSKYVNQGNEAVKKVLMMFHVSESWRKERQEVL